jgi:uncharacterized protein (TIGR03000 family)
LDSTRRGSGFYGYVPALESAGLAKGYQPYRSALTVTGSQTDQAVQIAIRVPSNAEVWFDGAKTQQAGESRAFVSPPLALHRTYTYQIRTRWTEGGRPVDRTHAITVQAGDRIGLDFTNGSRTQPYAYGTLFSGDENPGSFYPVLPRSSGSNPKVTPASEQSPSKGSGPPGSNDPYSLGVGQG